MVWVLRSSLFSTVGCGLLAVVVAAGAMTLTLRSADWNLTALVRVDSATRLGADARAVEPGFRTVHPGAYDGQFYWGIAVDPFAHGQVGKALDKPSYRYGHPLYGWLGWLLSAGQARAAAVALAALGLFCLFAAAATASWLGRRHGRSGWEGLFVALNPGLVSAAAHDLAEPLGAALLLGAYAAYLDRRRRLAWVFFALLPLAKEPLLLVVAAVVVWELCQRHLVGAAVFATAAVPALAWWLYARVHFGGWFTSGGTALAEPFSGWAQTLFGSTARRGLAPDLAVAVLAALILLFAIAGVSALIRRGPVELSYLSLAAVAICLAPNATAAFSTALRNTAFLSVLVPFVLATRPFRPSPAYRARGAPTSRLQGTPLDHVPPTPPD